MLVNTNHFINDLCQIISCLGEQGGLNSPSVYETAQVLRFAPPPEGVEPGLHWLLNQQQLDGGWGIPTAPHTRDVPTIAALLTLTQYKDRVDSSKAIESGLSFLRSQAEFWDAPVRSDLAVGAELLLPKMLADANKLRIPLPYEHYTVLTSLTKKKLDQIIQLDHKPGTPLIFTWEAWGVYPDKAYLDTLGSIGNNPAATAYWIYQTKKQKHETHHLRQSERYLQQAAHATQTHIPGVVPTAWPINRFEQSFVLHILYMAGLLDHPAIQDFVKPQLINLANAIGKQGIGFSDYFIADGDDTAAAIAVLKARNLKTDYSALHHFAKKDHFQSYHNEIQKSPSLTARAIHALSQFSYDVFKAQQYIISLQQKDGRWLGDKWHLSWLYNTWLAVEALRLDVLEYETQLASAYNIVLNEQKNDGGWGTEDGKSNITDTAYAVLILHKLHRHQAKRADSSLRKARNWLYAHYRPYNYDQPYHWISKQEFSPYRIDWVVALSAIIILNKIFDM